MLLDLHLMLIQSKFNRDITDQLVDGAVKVLERHKASYEHYLVPGAFETPAAIQFAIKGMEFAKARRRFSGYIPLACIIKGETKHFDLVADEVFRAISDLSLRYTIAIGNGILTTDTYDQALERANTQGRNWGGLAAETCIDMIELKSKFALLRG